MISTFISASNFYSDRPDQSSDENEVLKNKLQNSNKLIDSKYLYISEQIGSGHFGFVHKGHLKIPGNPTKEVAIKKFGILSNKMYLTCLKEAVIMKDFNNQYVLSLIGLVISDNQPQLILPYISKGDLRKYVQNNRCKVRELLNFTLDIAYGMNYLANRNFVHRDLAARNCMVGDSNILIADFGLTKNMYEKEYVRTNEDKALPLAWMAPESIKKDIYTTKSDVWSYGVTSWEVFSE